MLRMVPLPRFAGEDRDHHDSTPQSLKNMGFERARHAFRRRIFTTRHNPLPVSATEGISDDSDELDSVFLRPSRQAANRPPLAA
jgi:hypothetical protein